MEDHQFYKSERRDYSFGEVNVIRRFDLARSLCAILGDPGTHKIHEGIAFGVGFIGEDCNLNDDSSFMSLSDDKCRNESLLLRAFLGPEHVVTEIPYVGYDGRIMVMPALVPLAVFGKQSEELTLTVNAYPQLGINPQFLYDFAEKHGRRI